MFSENINKVISKSFGFGSPKGDVGIEIETEGRNLPAGKVTGTFTGKEDGSLRQGMEYVSSVLPSASVATHVDNLAFVLGNKGADINPTYRSSTHIHVNYCDKTWKDVLNTMVIWALVEPTIFRMMPPGRDGSLFCVSSYDSGDLTQFTEQLCQGIGNNFYQGFRPRGKYSSLNMTRLSDLGTMEYRVFPSSMSGDQIQQWVNWVMNIRRLSGAVEPLAFVRDAEQNPTNFLKDVLGAVPFDDAAQLVDFGARSAYEIARVINKHMKLPEKKPKAGMKAGPNDLMMVGLVENREAAAQPAEPFPWQPAPPRPLAELRGNVRRDQPGMVGAQQAIENDRQLRDWRAVLAQYMRLGEHEAARRLNQRIDRRVRNIQFQHARLAMAAIPEINANGEVEF
jgi:hypothetical protein